MQKIKEKAPKKEPDKLYELCTSMFSELEDYLEVVCLFIVGFFGNANGD